MLSAEPARAGESLLLHSQYPIPLSVAQFIVRAMFPEPLAGAMVRLVVAYGFALERVTDFVSLCMTLVPPVVVAYAVICQVPAVTFVNV